MAQPVLLAIETSQRQGGVAVRDHQGRTHVERLASTLRQDDDLLGAIDRLYARLKLKPKATEAVGVSIGPGAFTGLRIAVSTVKMICEALGTKIIAVPSALVAAASYEGPGPIIVTLTAKGPTAWATQLDRVGGMWQIIGGGRLIDADSLGLHQIKALVADEHLPQKMRAKCERAAVRVVEPMFDPRACLAVAAHRLDQGCTTDPLALGPLYPRRPEAVAVWERRHPS